MNQEWIACKDRLPEQGVEVETLIADARGVRNCQILRLHGHLWFFADLSMYVYYEPTHWRKHEKLERTTGRV